MNSHSAVVAVPTIFLSSVLTLGCGLSANDPGACATSEDLASASVGVNYDRFADRVVIAAVPTFSQQVGEILSGYTSPGDPTMSFGFECPGNQWCRPDSLQIVIYLNSSDEPRLRGVDSLRFLIDQDRRVAVEASGYGVETSRISTMSRYEEQLGFQVSVGKLREIACGERVEYRAGSIEAQLEPEQISSLRAIFVREYVDSLLVADEADSGSDTDTVASDEDRPSTPDPGEPHSPAAKLDDAADSPPEITASMINQGRTIFEGAGICSTCHGSDGSGLPNLGADLTDNRWLHSDGSYEGIVQTIKRGVEAEDSSVGVPMPARAGTYITDSQVDAVAAYVWSLSK